MQWSAYKIIFHLRSPMHIGLSKVGNLQQTRSYVTGRVFWGALTMRLTRESGRPASDSAIYKQFGSEVNDSLAWTYFYPALLRSDQYQVIWPWEDEHDFTYRFIRSYASSALSYPQQSPDEGMLHEVEFLSPHTFDTGEKVYLIGYIFEKEGCTLRWKEALTKLQFGGERSYGWGDVRLATTTVKVETFSLFNNKLTCDLNGKRPLITVSAHESITAHTPAEGLEAEGSIEPLVGREWRSYNTNNEFAGQHVEFNNICFTPGSTVIQKRQFTIEDFGIWKPVPIA
jgi:hypothetical protein